MSLHNLQLRKDGRLKHFLTVEGLSKEHLLKILDITESFINLTDRPVKNIPILRGHVVANLFFENSTRTRTTFELAAKRLSADVLNLNISTSATAKGESLLDTLRNLESMHIDMFIIRHSDSGAAHFIAKHARSEVSIINAGDGSHAHPTQAMLDMFTIRNIKGKFISLKIAIIGDILHSRVARSQILAFNILGVSEIRIIGPKTLIPKRARESFGVHVYHDIEKGIAGVDVIIILRLQKERMHSAFIPSRNEYYQRYGLTTERIALASTDAIVMHPGPINRGIEIDSEVADGNQSVILQQVNYGIAVRMAVMSMIMQSPSAGVQI